MDDPTPPVTALEVSRTTAKPFALTVPVQQDGLGQEGAIKGSAILLRPNQAEACLFGPLTEALDHRPDSQTAILSCWHQPVLPQSDGFPEPPHHCKGAISHYGRGHHASLNGHGDQPQSQIQFAGQLPLFGLASSSFERLPLWGVGALW